MLLDHNMLRIHSNHNGKGATEGSSGEESPEPGEVGSGQGSRGQRRHDGYPGGGQSCISCRWDRRGDDCGRSWQYRCGSPERPRQKRSEGSSGEESPEPHEAGFGQGSRGQRRRLEDRGGSQQYHSESPEQPQQKLRRGTDPRQHHGESGSSYADGPSWSSVPDLYQATRAPLQPVTTSQPMLCILYVFVHILCRLKLIFRACLKPMPRLRFWLMRGL
ncbi:uncharacterized protein LOC110919495 [Helianthus annuus]|uniref:uncharacterized protein LOC110919495 n=1 Tax=Helianthus annuus TaxID=4232 RepID=UPI000B8FC153|nr:uncharacterized protein LOC110919495 [Helianthus annuus]